MERVRQAHLDITTTTCPKGPVECLGMTFASDEERRSYFTERLREKLQNPEFRKIEGFPIGNDEDILRLSDPPYHTACPNPFLEEFIRCYGRPYDPDEQYHRQPFAVDVSEGKTDPIYAAHPYHTKVPHKAIMRAILHYTEPGDIVLDGFAGSGMTGVAAQLCGSPSPDFRETIEQEWREAGKGEPKWGVRRAILNDLGPAATFIAANYNLPFDVDAFEQEATRILVELKDEIGWMYETLHSDGISRGPVNFTVWSEIFSCPECGAEVNFVDEALDNRNHTVKERFDCPKCGVELTKERLDRIFQTTTDPATAALRRHIRFVPVLINYTVGTKTYEKRPDVNDQLTIERISNMPLHPSFPTTELPISNMYHGSRLHPKGFTHVHHLYLARSAQALGHLWAKIHRVQDPRLTNALRYWAEQAFWTGSVLNRYRPTGYSQVNQYLTGVYYVASQHAECSPWYILKGKLSRLVKTFKHLDIKYQRVGISTGTTASLAVPTDSIDYIFTDPPFGENIYYADLNYMVESWHSVWTNSGPEAIVDKPKNKSLQDYNTLTEQCFREYYRVLKPGRWMTVVFHNSHNTVWNVLQDAMLAAGFIVADVRELDKQQGSYRQVTSPTVKQDLVISVYKPTEEFEKRIRLKRGSEETIWEFVRGHLEQVPKFAPTNSKLAQVIPDRTAEKLFDRVVAYHVRNNLDIPFSLPEFRNRLVEPLVKERDGMYFLPHQVLEYEQKRYSVEGVQQMQVLVTDESTAIQWLRQELYYHPQSRPDLTPKFMKAMGGWAKGEVQLELIDILNDSFLEYEGKGPIPMQIWTWMEQDETYRKYVNGKDREQPTSLLCAESKGLWYVPDPNQEQDLEKLRQRTLIRVFEEYKQFKGRQLKLFRMEAVKAGFKKAYADKDYQTIIEIAAKLPEDKLHGDPFLLRWYNNALTRAGRNG